MSAFIDKDDYGAAIKGNILDAITEATDALLDTAEEQAISFVASYLNAKFDVAAIFAQTGSDRDPTILRICIDIALYYLHRRTTPRKIPDHRVDAYNEAKEWLEGVRAEEIVPIGLPLPEDGSRQYIGYGSNDKRDNHI